MLAWPVDKSLTCSVMSIGGINSGSSRIVVASGRSTRYFDRGGTFERVGGYASLFARRFGRDLTGLTTPGAGLRSVGGAASNLSRAFVRRQESSPESSTTESSTTGIDVVA